jgi:hypothetical protein
MWSRLSPNFEWKGGFPVAAGIVFKLATIGSGSSDGVDGHFRRL